jgi:hypothetical protein
MNKAILLQALDLDKAGEWEKAHEVSQAGQHADAFWLHAYLHRKEGDLGNAAYWYHRAGREVPDMSLEEEWAEMYKAFSS